MKNTSAIKRSRELDLPKPSANGSTVQAKSAAQTGDYHSVLRQVICDLDHCFNY